MTTVANYGRRTRAETALGLLRAARPRQWTKNLVVLSVPVAAGALIRVSVLTDTLL
jgi:decaprenyl-phosphate phosphoribosyltransferase